MTKVGLIIQARMGSTRLAGKVLRPVGELPLLGHVIGRLKSLPDHWITVVATSNLPQDNPVADWCGLAGVALFRGSELDVLQRYAQCAKQFGFDHVVRLTADNPFTDIEELNRLIRLHLQGGFDYTHSFGMMPLGVGAEIFTEPALLRSEREGVATHHREHVNEYIQENTDLFRIGVLDVPLEKRCPELRLTIDTEQDWQRADALARASTGRWLGTQEAIALCLQFV
jgi:spore coat polysaccharide biosynthesis protein SpsF